MSENWSSKEGQGINMNQDTNARGGHAPPFTAWSNLPPNTSHDLLFSGGAHHLQHGVMDRSFGANTQAFSGIPMDGSSAFGQYIPGLESDQNYQFRNNFVPSTSFPVAVAAPADPSLMDYGNLDSYMEEDFEDPRRGTKKRKLGKPEPMSKPKRSILEDLLILLDDGRYGIKWCVKVDTEGDLQDGMQIYNETTLEQALEERRSVVGYGLSKHLAKDLRYYGFIYDKEPKVFWNEDHKDHLTHRSYWQKDDRSKCLQLKRMTSEAERNLSRLSSLIKNTQLAEILKVPEHVSICPPPSKYINLYDLRLVFPSCTQADSENIKALLEFTAANDTIKFQWQSGMVLTKAFDHLLYRLGTTVPDFIADLREFVLGATRWYHGPMERDEAVTVLSGYPEGTFLIRESTQSDCYSLSWVKFSPEQNALVVNHMRVEQTTAGFAVHGDEAPARTLVQWICLHSNYLKNPLPNPAYSQLQIVQVSEKKSLSVSETNLPADYIRGFPSMMESSNPPSPFPMN